ncbi:hypothetical protein [Ralstonia solanacearum]|uniref:hypothetical protein n=1 Tax=Ralstonia solanacearum TaxID=305 RepID=UPI001FF8DE48
MSMKSMEWVQGLMPSGSPSSMQDLSVFDALSFPVLEFFGKFDPTPLKGGALHSYAILRSEVKSCLLSIP